MSQEPFNTEASLQLTASVSALMEAEAELDAAKVKYDIAKLNFEKASASLGTLITTPSYLFDQSVEARNALQHSGKVHPYTCGNDECRHVTNQYPLRATTTGWVCDHCGYTQPLSQPQTTSETQ